ncbi:hypothetical protein [Photobacterium profundum]|uniref:hypothetical protein n=1 Tax=Photobacterium profundum TaxID=74109 RepID=UPI003D0C8136
MLTFALKAFQDNYLILNKWEYSHNKSKTKSLCALKRAKVEPLVRGSEEYCNSFDSLMSFINTIGLPIVFNRNFEASLKASEEQLNTPLMFPVILSFHEMLRGKLEGCYLYEHCSNQDKGYITDINCKSKPWTRARQKKSCYFSNVWNTWGLENVKITVE